MTMEKTDFDNAIEVYQGYHEASANEGLTRNHSLLKSRADELNEAHDFIHVDSSSESNFVISIYLGGNVAGRIVVANDSIIEAISFSIFNLITRENYTVRSKQTQDRLLYTNTKSSDNPFDLEQRFVNKSYIDYVVMQLLRSLSVEISKI